MRIVKLFVIYLIVIIYSLEILTFLFIPSEQKSMVDVKNTRIKLAIEKKIKFDARSQEQVYVDLKNKIKDVIQKSFRPEFINRIDDIIAFNSSDINLKENITVIPNALNKINAISGNTFTWKSDPSAYEHFGTKEDTGVIAQEVEALGLPGITTTRDDGTKAVRYDRLIPVLIQAVKELSAKVTALEGS